MNFDNEQAAISEKYVVCVRVKRRRDLVYREKNIQNSQAFAK